MTSGSESITIFNTILWGRAHLAAEDQTPVNVNRLRVLDAEEVSDFTIVCAIVNHEIRTLASFERPRFIASAQTVCRVDGCGGESFGGRHLHLCGSERERHRHRRRRAGAWIKICGEHDREAGIN